MAVAASLLLHAAVLAALGWSVAPLRWTARPSPPEPVVELRLGATAGGGGTSTRRSARPAVAAPRTAPHSSPAAAAARTVPASPAPSPEATRSPTPPGPPAPGPGAAASTESGAAPGPPLSSGERGALRGLLGCAGGGGDLAPEERARCAERLGLASRTAPRIDPVPAEKRAYYDAVAAAYARAHAPPANAPAWFAGPARRSVLDDRGGLTIPVVGCEMKFGAPRGWKAYHDLPPHALKLARLGPLKCFVPPPSGRGFEESGVEAPASLREQRDDAAHMKALDPPKP